MNYHLNKNVMNDDAARYSFDALASKTFDLSFEKWYRDGYWTESNTPYTLFHKEEAIANISVNRLEVLWQGQKRSYIQLGTVMTDPGYRGQGLSRYLMEEIKSDWETHCDAMFLFANKDVLDFYPRFGFEQAAQYQFRIPAVAATGAGKKLDIDTAAGQEMLRHYYEKTNPFSKVQVVDNYGLLMFYCSSPLKDCIYYSARYDAVVIAKQEGDLMHCYDVYCDDGKKLTGILSSVATVGTKIFQLEFTSRNSGPFIVEPENHEEDTLFVLSSKENIFKNNKLLFPAISHT